MATVPAMPEVQRPHHIDEAVSLLAALGEDGEPLAGGTWIMRSSLRGEPLRSCYVALAAIGELRRIDAGPDEVSVGALLTHAELARLRVPAAVHCLVEAAARSAFPAVRSVATIGGNVCARGFPEADLVPALVALDAKLRLRSSHGERVLEIDRYLATREERAADELLVSLTIPAPRSRRSAFERLTVRGGGEYAVATVAVSVTLDDGIVSDARVAVGSVQEVARLCPAAREQLLGAPLDRGSADAAGRAAAAECSPRDGRDAPGWYREAVLPALVRRAVMRMTPEED
jgi:carbon-monoxide dehydrogenase medium subunit